MTDAVAQCEGNVCTLHEHDIDISSLATKEMCKEKHKWNIWAFGVIFALMSLFLALSGVALANSSSATGRIGDVQVEITERIANSDKTFEVHMARQEESTKALLATLDSMRESIDANTQTLKAQSEQISLQNRILEKLVESK